MRNLCLLIVMPSLTFYFIKIMTCHNYRLPSTCPNSPFPDCVVRALRKGSAFALPTLPLPCKICKSLEHLNHKREEGGQELVVLHREYWFSLNIVFICTLFFRFQGRQFYSYPSTLVFHELSAVLPGQKSAPRRHFKSKWSQICWQEPVTSNRAALRATVQDCSSNSG